ncbi:MAG: outer membrane beta-barrel domain-containing protein [Myxococcaceae bacterium]|nr:outer membrane beta-barrel domain-containing protein [Myxococcaceae bacterium]
MRSLIASLAVLVSASALAAPSAPVLETVLTAGAAPAPAASKPADDDEEDPAPGAKTAPKAEEKKAEAPAALGAVTVTPVPANADQQKLVSGAPLYNPNVAVHIVEQKKFSDYHRFEAILFPVVLQTNGKFTQHYGTAIGLVYHLNENFGFQVQGQYNWVNTESGFNGELITKVNEEAEPASSLLNVWGVVGGIEVTPIYGKFALYESTLAQFSLVLNAGAGIGGTRHQLKPDNAAGPATYGDTGSRFQFEVGGGFRLQLGKRFAIRAELRDLIYTARVDTVNGCDLTELKALALNSKANVGGSCNAGQFSGDADANLASKLVEKPTSDVLNNLGLYLGASFIF